MDQFSEGRQIRSSKSESPRFGAHSGDVGAIQEIAAEISKLGPAAKGQFEQLRQAFVEGVFKVNKPRHDRFMSMRGNPTPGIQQPATARILFVQYEAQQPHIVEITENGSATNCEVFGHHAIGVGDVFAEAHLWGYKTHDLTLDQAKILAFMIVKKAIEIAGFGLGPPIDIWTLTKATGQVAITRLSDNEKEGLEDVVSAIMQAQLEVFTGWKREEETQVLPST